MFCILYKIDIKTPNSFMGITHTYSGSVSSFSKGCTYVRGRVYMSVSTSLFSSLLLRVIGGSDEDEEEVEEEVVEEEEEEEEKEERGEDKVEEEGV